MPIKSAYLKKQCLSPQTYAKGVNYFQERRVQIISDEPMEGQRRGLSALVCGSGNATYRVEILISADGEAIKSCNCTCPAFASYNGICKHVVALTLVANQNEPPKITEIKSDHVALYMMRQYAEKAIMDIVPPVAGVKLTPTLELAGKVPTVSLKVGTERMYVVKDLLQFSDAIKKGELRVYGKNFSFHHCMSAFDKESVLLVQFLLTYYDKNNYMYAESYYYRSNDRNRSMCLPPFMLDAFLALYQGRVLNVEGGGVEQSLTVRTENPKLGLHISRKENNSYTLSLSKQAYVMQGGTGIYLASEKSIYCCDPAFSQATKEMFAALPQGSKGRLTIGAHDMPVLAATLLPTLQPYLSVESDSDLSEFQPPARQSKVYFDMPEPEKVTARLEHHYGERSHLGFHIKDVRQSLDVRGETQIEALLGQYLKEPNGPGEVKLEDDESALYELVAHGMNEITQLAEVFSTDRFTSMGIKPPAAVSVGVRVESNLLRLHFDVEGMELSELEQVLVSYRKAKKYHRLRDGSFLNLEDSALSEFSALAQGMDLSAKEIMSGELSVPKYRALYLDTLLKQSDRLQYDRDGAFKKMIRDVRDVSDADYPIPKSLRQVLRNYQKTGYRWLRTIAAYGFGGILADDMGLGKTLQVIALLLAQKEEQTGDTCSMVVCPSSLVLNWESEVHKFAPALNVVAVAGSATYREECIREGTGAADLFITSYDSLKRDVELYEDMPFQYVVADEAQYMKNQNTQNAKAVKTLHSAVRLALTGTPVENSLAEVWSIFDFLMPGYLYHYTKFRKNFEMPIVKQSDETAASSLRKMVSPFILRRMKKEVLKELPDKIETVLYAELEGEQKKVYRANAAEARRKLEGGLGETDKLEILALLTRLRQVCCDPALVYENYTADSAKLELCMELLKNCVESGHRVLLFSQFTSMLARIAARLEGDGIPYFTITGETKVSQRLELVNTFNQGDTPLFLISLKAGGTGLNLTGADVVVHYDPWWNSSAQNQATDRAHRIGQTKTVQVYKLIAKDTLEERILEMQKSKSDLADMIVREGDGAFARMSKHEILALFE